MKKHYLSLLGIAALLVVACGGPKSTTANKTTTTTTTSTATSTTTNAASAALTAVGIDLNAKIPLDPTVKTGVLSNGLIYYIQNNGKPEDKVELRLAINAGSILEDDDQQGLAHMMEHMNFNGTTNFQKNELVDYLQGIGVKFGADLNAYTSFDETVYILPIPSDDPEKLDNGFTILSDWAGGALLETDAINDERGVILEESRTGKGANDRMNKVTFPVIFANSKYAERLPIGKDDIIQNFNPDAIRRFQKDWYRPDLMAVIAVGDLDVATLEAKIKEHFGDIPAAENPRKREEFGLPNHEETLIAIAQDPEASFAQVRIQYKDSKKAEPTTTVSDLRDDLVNGLFSQMMNNRLQELTTKPNPPFIFGSSSYGGTGIRGKNSYSSFAGTAPDGQLTALKTLLEENQRVKLYGFQASEFERAKTSYKSFYETFYKDRDKRESGRIVGAYVNHFLVGDMVPSVEYSYEMAMKLMPTITIEEINAKMDDYIHDDNRSIVFTGPETENKPTEADILKILNDVANSKIDNYQDTEVRENLIEKLPTAGAIAKTTKNDKLGTTTYTLSNGATITTKKTDFKNDEILMSAYSYGGTSLFSDEEYLAVNQAMGGVTEGGIAGLNQTDMGKYMSGKLVRVSPRVGSISENFNGSSTPDDLETMFQLIHLYFTDINKDTEAYKSYIDKQKSFLGSYLSRPESYFSNEVNNYRFGSSPRYTGFPTPEMMDAADYDKAYQLFKERFSDAGDFNFYLVGNIDDAQIQEFAKTYIASLPSSGKKEMYKINEWREDTSKPRKKVVKKGLEEKSTVQIVWTGKAESYSAKENMALDALGEIATIKIIETLREQEGGIYGGGARGSLSKITYPRYNFSISFPCGPDNVDKLVAAALNELEMIKNDGPTDKDMNKVKEAYLLEYKENLESNRFWLNSLYSADYEQKDPNKILDFEASVAKLTKADVQAAAKKYIDENYLLAVLLPEDK
ncbi:probable zinc protease PqqL [Nonlabens ulvanivorans]|nr:insulinase family protein [Nonlabens ulvanivorans]GAK90566.1 probable zinc protease PqqL [Nonlabens ulvanivorans]